MFFIVEINNRMVILKIVKEGPLRWILFFIRGKKWEIKEIIHS